MIWVTTRAVCVPRVCHRWDEGHTPADGQLKVSVADPQPSFLTSDSLPMPADDRADCTEFLGSNPEDAKWRMLIHVLVMSNEFLFVD